MILSLLNDTKQYVCQPTTVTYSEERSNTVLQDRNLVKFCLLLCLYRGLRFAS